MIRFLTAFIAILAASAALAQVPDLPDLDVTYIKRTPRNIGVGFEFINGLPKPVCDCITQPQFGRGPFQYHPHPKPSDIPPDKMTKSEQQKLCRHWPQPGQEVTFIAHVKNAGGATAPPAPYVFLMDGRRMIEGKLPELEPGVETTVPCKWKWQNGDHTVEFKVFPQRIEICDRNNGRAEKTNAIWLTLRAHSKEVYDAFNKTGNQIGSYSFEDWAQYHIDVWNQNLAEAKYPATTPKGVTERIRFDGIFYPESQEQKDRLAGGEDWVNWDFNWDIADVPRYAKTLDWGLIHELCHQCGMIDLYQVGVRQVNVLVRGDDGQYVTIGHYHGRNCLMGTDRPPNPKTCFSEFTAGAFQHQKGWPRWGYGINLFDIPAKNIVQVLDNRGNPIAGAKVKLYQQDDDTMIGRIPPMEFTTDRKGRLDLGDFPFAKMHVVGWTGVLMLEVRAREQVEYHFLDVTQFNIAYDRGDTKKHTFVMKTGIVPEGGPPRPHDLQAKMLGYWKCRLTWKADGNPRTVRLLTSDSNMDCSLEPPFRTLMELSGSSRQVTIDLQRDGRANCYAVQAVDDLGRESPPSDHIRPPDYALIRFLLCPGTLTAGPDDTCYVFDLIGGVLHTVERSGRHTNLIGQINLGDVADIKVSADGSKLYYASPEAHKVSVTDLASKKTIREFGADDLKEPRRLALSKDGTVFVGDAKLGGILVFDKDGKRTGAITDLKGAPTLAFDDSRALLAATDYENNCLRLYSYRDGKTAPAATIENLPHVWSVAFGPDGRIYCGGQWDGLKVLSPDGDQIGTWTSKPFASCGGLFVHSVSVAPSGNVYLTQGNNNDWVLRVTPDEIEWQTAKSDRVGE